MNSNFRVYKVNDDTFVGIIFRNNCVELYVPSLYNIGLKKDITDWNEISDKPAFKANFLKLLNTISIARTNEINTGSEYSDFIKSDNAFGSMLWLIKDYINNGLYCEFGKKQLINSSGKINWKKTLKQVPYINQNEEFIFNSLVVDKKVKVDKIITDIYKICLQISINTIGWIWNINQKIIDISGLNTTLKKYYCSVLKKELRTTFLDSKKERLEYLLNILQGLSDSEKPSYSYGVKSYHVVFEKMIDRMFGNVENISDYYPSATWHFVNNVTKPASKLRPDTIMIMHNDEKYHYIIDAKYYDCKNGEYCNFPSSSDIQKQITYGNYLESKLNKSNIRNVFILPCDKTTLQQKSPLCERAEHFNKNNSEINFDYFGYATANWINGNQTGKDYEKVMGFYIDLKFLIDNFNNSNDDFRNDLQTMVEKALQIINI